MYGDFVEYYDFAVHCFFGYLALPGGASPSPTLIWDYLRIVIRLYCLADLRGVEDAAPYGKAGTFSYRGTPVPGRGFAGG